MGKYKNLKERLGDKSKYYVGDLDLENLNPYSRQYGVWQCEKCGEVFEPDIYDAVSLKTCVEKRLTVGAPGKAAMDQVIAMEKEYLESDWKDSGRIY